MEIKNEIQLRIALWLKRRKKNNEIRHKSGRTA